jgi:hypothetical protein
MYMLHSVQESVNNCFPIVFQLDRTLAPGAPISALVEKIKEGEELAEAVHRLANRASRYAVRENSFSRKIVYRDVPV